MTKSSDTEFAHIVMRLTLHSNKSYLRDSHRNLEGCHIQLKKQDTTYTQNDKVQTQENFISIYSLGIYKVVEKLKKNPGEMITLVCMEERVRALGKVPCQERNVPTHSFYNLLQCVSEFCNFLYGC